MSSVQLSFMRAFVLRCTFTASLFGVPAFAGDPSATISTGIGPFAGHTDIGPVRHPGTVVFDAERQRAEVSGSGTNMWFAADEFHFVWKRMRGDFILRARARLLGEGGDPHRKLGWMVRSDLQSDSAYVDAAVHGDGLTSLQFRRAKGADTEEVRSTVQAPDVIQLERKGNVYTMSVARFGETFVSNRLENLELGDDVYVGIFVCAHNPDAVERAVFQDVRIVVPAPDDFRPYRDYLGSRLEILEVATGNRELVYETPAAIQAPNWTSDGGSLIYNGNGRLYRFDLKTRTPTPIDTGFATRNNNDHALSFDGGQLAISHHSADHQNQSIVYTVPSAGGTPRQITQQGPSYLHGWSPDGKWLVFTGQRDGELDVYRIAVAGGNEINLTNSPGLDDGPEYSPDGKYVYFNSVRSGLMQIWRMNSDGSNPRQMTHDGFNNWFPHVSPDGHSIVFLSFGREVDPSDHPFYKHVYLQRMPAAGGESRVIAYIYGGQGTINVPGWSPDGKFVAFVSNSVIADEP